MEISALNHLIYLNEQNFIDPRSKASTLESTIIKVLDLYKVALSCDSPQVHKAVAQGYIHILESCIKPKYGIDIPKIDELLVISLEKCITSGEDKLAQYGASHCFYFLVKAAHEKGYKELFHHLYSKYLDIFKVSYSCSTI